MKVSRTSVKIEMASIRRLDLKETNSESLRGDNRPLMRHSDGALHAAVIETIDGSPRMSLFGFKDPDGKLQRLAGPISSDQSMGDSQPATDSNQNGTYIAYIEAGKLGQTGHVVHIPDTFGEPTHFKVHGPLTPADGRAQNSFLQASRGYNSVIYGWRDGKSGDIYAGVSRDGSTFPSAKLVVQDRNVVNGPATAVHGDYALIVYQTANSAFAPKSGGQHGRNESYYAYSESGDGGESWSKPAALIPDAENLPKAIAYSLSRGNDLRRSEVRLSAVAPRDSVVQALAWATETSGLDSRLFALTSVVPAAGLGRKEAAGSTNKVGVLTWKRITVGGDWEHVLTNRSLFLGTERTKRYAGRIGSQYKYCALPGTPVRVVAYVEKAPSRSKLEEQISIIISTNMGDSFDYEPATFSASQLQLEPDAEIVITNSACNHVDREGNLWQDLLVGDLKRPQTISHALLPVGINIRDIDPTKTW